MRDEQARPRAWEWASRTVSVVKLPVVSSLTIKPQFTPLSCTWKPHVPSPAPDARSQCLERPRAGRPAILAGQRQFHRRSRDRDQHPGARAVRCLFASGRGQRQRTVEADQVKGAQTTLVGLWVDVDGTTVLGWCSLAALAADTGAPSTTPATWPAFGTFHVGDTVQFYTFTGWKQGIIKEVGPGPGQPTGDRWHAVKKYLITRTESHAQISTVAAGRNGAAWPT